MTDLALRSLTYCSRAVQPFDDEDFRRLGLEAARLNALDGVTGLLVFNGGSFCQTIEGAPEAIGDLAERLRRDARHRDFTVLSDLPIGERRFRSWDMQLLSVPDDREQAIAIARTRFEQADLAARERIYETVAGAFA
jgi:hypothetical protein